MKLNPYLRIVLAAIIWGSGGVFVKLLNLPATVLSFFRLAVPAIVLLAYLVSKKKRIFQTGHNWLLVLASLLMAAHIYLMVVGLKLAPLSSAIIVIYTWPVFAMIFSRIFLKEKISRRNALLLVMAFVGAALVFVNQRISLDNKVIVGLLCLLAVAVLYSLATVIMKKGLARISEYEAVFYQNVAGALIFLPFLFFNPLPSLAQVGGGIAYGLLIGVVSFVLFYGALKVLKATTASHLAYLEVLSAIIFGMVVFGESLSWNVVAGGILIVGSTLLIQKKG